ncbi:hypothetical protein [Pseudoduganella sp. GCM10020061]|uniref:hypothetical protein n=1 Tax=Pseudoduganella sp. GCM10020061 TaxID=3317345 RepID=UPI00362BB7BC
MPIVGLGLHFLVALYFAVHAVRTRREMYWLLILFSFPILGSVVYFFAIYLPHSRLEHTLIKAGRTVRDTLDPGRALREAQQAFDLTPTAQNQMKLANAMLEAGMFKDAVQQFDACLRGPFAGDPEIIFAASRALRADGQAPAAVSMLEELRRKHPSFRPEAVSLALAAAYASAGRQEEAGAEFASAVDRFGSLEARVEYTLWAVQRNERGIAETQLAELDHARRHMNQYARSLHGELFARLDAATKTDRMAQR